MKTLSRLLILSSLFSSSRATSINAGLSSTVNDIDFARSVSHCAQVSARALFSPSNDLSIIGSIDSPRLCDIVQELLKATFASRSLKIFTSFSESAASRSQNSLARDTSFLVIDDAANLRRLMSESSAERWAEYIIVVVQETTDWLAEFADYLASLGFTNVAFVSFTAEGRSTLLRPVSDSASTTSKTSVRIFDICLSKNQANPTNQTTVRPFSSFDPDDPSNRNLSFARILEGTENPNEFATIKNGKTTSFGVDVLGLLTNRHNIELLRYEWANQTASTWTEAMQRCLAGEFDYFYAVLPPSRNVPTHDIEAVAWYKYEFLTFVDTPRKPTMELTDILMPYHGTVWFCAFGLFGAFAVFAYAIDRLWQRGLIRERITVLTIWSIFVDQSLPALPVKFGLRFVIGMWVFHNFVKNAGYTALFSSALTATDDSYMLKTFQDVWQSGKPICGSRKVKQLLNDDTDPVIYGIYNSNACPHSSAGYTALFSSALTATDDSYVLKTFQDVWQSGKPICGSRKVKQLLNDDTDPVIYGIYNRFKVIHPRGVLDAVINQSCIGTRHLSIVERHNMVNRANASRRLYTPSEAIIIEYPSFYYARKRNRYNKELKKIVTRAYESGIVSWIEQKYLLQMDKTSGEIPVSTEDPNLRLTHLLIVFQLLLVGHFISLVVFVIEIYTHTHHNSAKRFDERKS